MPTITPLPAAPSRADPATFAERGDEFAGALPTFAAELQVMADLTMASIALPGSHATSNTSLTIGTGIHSLSVEAGKAFVAGADVCIAYASGATNRMVGVVTAYDSGTGAMTVDVTSYAGGGTHAAWEVSLGLAVAFDGRTYSDLRLAGKMTETVYTLTGTVIDPSNGSIQTKALAANTTFSTSLADGQSVALILSASTYTVTWPSMIWAWGAAPTLPTTGAALLVLFRVAGVVYGIYAGSLA